MGYDSSWVVARLRRPGRLWAAASSLTLAVVGLFSKLVVGVLNRTTVYNRAGLERALGRPPGTPLLTVSNHHSCFDDPGLWGALPLRTLLRPDRMRWSLAAHDICFTGPLHTRFFALGRCVPVVRGAGVHQPAMDFMAERLRHGDWVHVFPEGRVNAHKEFLRLKWGVGRLAAECGPGVLVLPLWHEGMDCVLPNREPYVVRGGRRVFLCVGEPVPLGPLLARLRAEKASEEATRRALTDRIQNELLRLRDRTHRRMRRALGPAADSLLADRSDVLVRAPPDPDRTEPETDDC